jgi:hypothetical protein
MPMDTNRGVVLKRMEPGWTNFHSLLRLRGVPAFTWGGVIHPSLDLHNYPDGKFLYDNLILPHPPRYE